MSTPTGWCISQQHDQCKVEYVTWGGLGSYRRCGCECHPAVTDEHVAEFLAEHKHGDLPASASVRPVTRRKRAVISKSTEVQPKAQTFRNLEAEAKAAAALDEALAGIEGDEEVVKRMKETS